MVSEFEARFGLGVMRTLGAVIVSVLCSSIGSLAVAQPGGAAGRGGMCITTTASQSVEQCPANAPQTKRVPLREAPRSRLVASRSRPRAEREGPSGPSYELSAEARRNRSEIEARARDLLQREIRVLNRLVRNTRQADPQRPDILLRLAETYFEMLLVMNAEMRSFDEPIFQARQARNGQEVRRLRQSQREAEERIQEMRRAAVGTYATLVEDHPDFPRMDEVLFSLAFELDELKEHENARTVYRDLIQRFPQSRFVPNAYLSFAEYFFNEQEMAAALQFYDRVVEYPPESGNTVYGYALYKAAWAHFNIGNTGSGDEGFRNSLQKFIEVIEFARQNPDVSGSTNLARQSRRELVMPYARVGDPDRALPLFRRYASDGEEAFRMLESLAEAYYDSGQWGGSISVYQRLIAEQPRAGKVCYWQTQVSTAIVASRSKAEQVREVERLVDIYETFMGQEGHSQESVDQCQQEAATLLVSLATSWHRETVGVSDEQPGTNDVGTMQLAARLYSAVLEKFPNLDSMEFPKFERSDWPSRYKLSYYHAELLWKMEDWTRCGPAFDRVVEVNPSGEYTADAAFAAVLCYNNLYKQEYEGRERSTAQQQADEAASGRRRRGRRPAPVAEVNLEPREFTELEEGMLRAFRRYVCFIPESQDLPTIKYRRARIYYEANRFEEAAVVFKDIAYSHPDSELAEFAANLYLDSLNALNERSNNARPECVREIKESIPELWPRFCEANAADHEQLCSTLSGLRCTVLRKEAEALEGSGEFEQSARLLVKIVRENSGCGQLDELLWNAALMFERAKLLGRAIQVRKVLIQQVPDSRYAKLSMYLVGANYHALAIYAQAAEWYERFAREFPGQDGSDCTEEEGPACREAVAHEALMQAVFFRIGLGEEDKAIEDAELFARNYRRGRARETSQVIFSLGSIYERRRAWADVVDHYRDFLRTYRRSALPHQMVRASVEIAKAYLAAGDEDRARTEFAAAWRSFERGTMTSIERLRDVTDEERAQYAFEAKDAASEALYNLALFEFKAFTAIRFPAYRGGRSMQRVNAWARNDFLPWVRRKQEALMAAKAAFERILQIEVPRWQISAAARVGEMWRSFVDEFRDAPVPREIESDPELMDVYLGALDEQSQPFVEEAKGAFRFCLETATQVRWFNDDLRQCELELNRLDPGGVKLAAELRGGATNQHRTPGRPGPILELRRGEEELEDEGDAVVEGAGGS